LGGINAKEVSPPKHEVMPFDAFQVSITSCVVTSSIFLRQNISQTLHTINNFEYCILKMQSSNVQQPAQAVKKNKKNNKRRRRFFQNVRPRQSPPSSKATLRQLAGPKAPVPGVDFATIVPLPTTIDELSGNVRRWARNGSSRFKYFLELYLYKKIFVPNMTLADFDIHIAARHPFDVEDKCWDKGEVLSRGGGGRLDIFRALSIVADMIAGRYFDQNFIDVAACKWENSHICNRHRCVNPNHIYKESTYLNRTRVACVHAGICIRAEHTPCRIIPEAVYKSWIPQDHLKSMAAILDFSKKEFQTGCVADNMMGKDAFLNLEQLKLRVPREMKTCLHVPVRELKKGKCMPSCPVQKLFESLEDFEAHWAERHSGVALGTGAESTLSALRRNKDLGPPELPQEQARTPTCIFEQLHLRNAELLAWLRKHLCKCGRDLGPHRDAPFCAFGWWNDTLVA
jgi:hypothetical protein